MRISLGARHDFLRRYGVADSWRAQTLGDLARVVGGGTPSREESRFWIGGRIPWATPTDLTANQAKYISKTAECITEAGLASSAASLLPADSILYTSRATVSGAEAKVDAIARRLSAFGDLKRALMHDLLTGRVRVKSSAETVAA